MKTEQEYIAEFEKNNPDLHEKLKSIKKSNPAFAENLLTQVAGEILVRIGEKIEKNEATLEDCFMAQKLCFDERDNIPLQPAIKNFCKIADFITEGIFSAQIEAWGKAREKH
jgi:hypothetical protein